MIVPPKKLMVPTAVRAAPHPRRRAATANQMVAPIAAKSIPENINSLAVPQKLSARNDIQRDVVGLG